MTAYENLPTQKEKATELVLIFSSALHDSEKQAASKKLKFDKFLFKKFLADQVGVNPISVSTDQNVLLIQFCVKGSSNFTNPLSETVVFKQAEYNMLLLPKHQTSTIANTADCDLVHIYLAESFFLHYLSSDYGIRTQDLFGTGKLFHNNLYINPKLKNILTEIEGCDFGGTLKDLYIKAKIIELLSLQLAQYEEEKIAPSKLNSLEVEKMILAKEIIDGNIATAHSISSLARAVGTNEQYLKTHFKLLFGSTVFNYIRSCKMHKAKDMLLTGRHQIAEIAETVGYKHATHFTSAFKKFFGCLPQSLKASKILIGTYFSLGIEIELMELLMIV